MNAQIIDRGRGPEIAGTRITVYDIWEYASGGIIIHTLQCFSCFGRTQ